MKSNISRNLSTVDFYRLAAGLVEKLPISRSFAHVLTLTQDFVDPLTHELIEDQKRDLYRYAAEQVAKYSPVEGDARQVSINVMNALQSKHCGATSGELVKALSAKLGSQPYVLSGTPDYRGRVNYGHRNAIYYVRKKGSVLSPYDEEMEDIYAQSFQTHQALFMVVEMTLQSTAAQVNYSRALAAAALADSLLKKASQSRKTKSAKFVAPQGILLAMP